MASLQEFSQQQNIQQTQTTTKSGLSDFASKITNWLPFFDKKEEKISDVDLKVREAREKGYTGDQCGSCSSMRVKRNGSCTVCDDCGTTSGCS